MTRIPDSARSALHSAGQWASSTMAAFTRLIRPGRVDPAPSNLNEPYYKGMTRAELRSLCAKAYEEAAAALADGQYQDVLATAEALDHLTGDQNLRNRNLRQLRLMRADALAMSGEGFAACRALDEIDAYYGPTWDSYIRRASFALFTGQYDEGIAAAELAMLIQPVRTDPSRSYQKAALLKMDLLSQSGEYERAREFFLRIYPGNDPRRPLTYNQLATFRKTIKDKRALALFKDLAAPAFGYRGRRAISALFHYSIAARDLGCYQEALLAIQRRFIVGSKVLAPGAKKPSEKVDWSTSARRALLDLRSDLSNAGIDFFLVSGTLLGCIREGGILGHDKDIDVGVMDEHSPAQVRSALENKGRFMVLPEISQRLLRVKHINGVMIDVFIHWKEGGQLWHEGQKTRWWNTPFNLIETEFLGEAFMVPDDADLYLTENYGDWRVPVHDFETFCDTPNMVVSNEDEILWYYQRALLDHYYAGRDVQFGRVWAEIKKLSRPGVEMRMAVERAQSRLRGRSIEGAD